MFWKSMGILLTSRMKVGRYSERNKAVKLKVQTFKLGNHGTYCERSL